jgi:hypothetical protein
LNLAADLKDLAMSGLIIHQGGMFTEEVDHAAWVALSLPSE